MFQIQDARRLNAGDDNLAKLEKEVTLEHSNALKVEESMKQESKVQWLELEDGNNTFFHRTLMVRRNKNQIRRIKIKDGSVVEDEEGIREEAEIYYKKILAPTAPNHHVDSNWQPNKLLTEDQRTMLAMEMDEEEIKSVIWSGKERKGKLRA